MLLRYGAHNRDISSVLDVVKLMLNPLMMSAVAIYIAATLLWVYILTKIPISYAYPIQALAFPMVVALSFLIFKETVPINRWIGVGIIVIGSYVASR